MYKRKLGKKEIKALESVLGYLERQRKQGETEMDIIKRRNAEEQISNIHSVLYKKGE